MKKELSGALFIAFVIAIVLFLIDYNKALGWYGDCKYNYTHNYDVTMVTESNDTLTETGALAHYTIYPPKFTVKYTGVYIARSGALEDGREITPEGIVTVKQLIINDITTTQEKEIERPYFFFDFIW